MIKLTELLHSVEEENKEGLVKIDDWRWPDVDHLVTMGFEFMDDYRLATDKEPHIVVYKKKDKDDKGEPTEFFFIEEPKRELKRFKNFNDVIDYFDKYEQPEIDKNLK
jgi:hypothetical protein